MVRDNVRRFLQSMQGLTPAPTDHLSDGLIKLRLLRYTLGTPYVGELPSYFFSIRLAKAPYTDLGRCDLRVGWADAILYAGNIGYRIFESHRGSGYAGRATKLLLSFACELMMEEVLITCDPDNLASRKTLERILPHRYEGIVQVAENTPSYNNGDRAKCLFYYQTKDFKNILSD